MHALHWLNFWVCTLRTSLKRAWCRAFRWCWHYSVAGEGLRPEVTDSNRFDFQFYMRAWSKFCIRQLSGTKSFAQIYPFFCHFRIRFCWDAWQTFPRRCVIVSSSSSLLVVIVSLFSSFSRRGLVISSLSRRRFVVVLVI